MAADRSRLSIAGMSSLRVISKCYCRTSICATHLENENEINGERAREACPHVRITCPADANVLFDTKEQSSALSSGIATVLPVGANVDIAVIRANITGLLNDQGRRHRRMPPGADVPLPKRCYVYAIHVDGVLRYFGKGTNGRMYAHMKEVQSG